MGDIHRPPPVMILLHAGGENRQVWEPVVAELQRRFPIECLTIDQRGHGESSGDRNRFAPIVEDLTDVLRALSRPAILVGCSLGGLAAVGAVADPSVAQSTLGIVLVDVVADLQPEPVWVFLEQAGLLPRAEEIAREILGVAGDLHDTLVAFPGQIALVKAETSAISGDDVERLADGRPDTEVFDVADTGHLIARDQPLALASILATTADSWLARGSHG